MRPVRKTRGDTRLEVKGGGEHGTNIRHRWRPRGASESVTSVRGGGRFRAESRAPSRVGRSAAVAFALVLASAGARADRLSDAAALFRRAKALIAKDKHAEACPLLAESYRLDPGMGTLLNLALCHEATGKVASAWDEFRSVEQQARAAVPPNEKRALLARGHADKLERRLSRLENSRPTPQVARVGPRDSWSAASVW